MEGSPTALFVSDAGLTVIRTDRGTEFIGDHLIVVDIAGKDRGIVSLLRDGLTEKEKKKYVSWTSAGPMWAACSLWYFLDAGEQPLFIVRPWWGRRIVLDLNSGKLIPETPDIAKRAAPYEKDYVLAGLRRDASSLGDPFSRECRRFMTAAYAAGRDKIMEAIPMLEELQSSSLIGFGVGWGSRKGEVDQSTYFYSTFTLRQIVQLSLRRLGITPKPLPITQFSIQHNDSRRELQHTATEINGPRAANASKIKPGMTPEEVINLIGTPDFVDFFGIGDGSWRYDMDAAAAFTLFVQWGDDRKVVRVEQKTPPHWQDSTRDGELMQFIP
jgi:hypothetical protein